MGLNFIALKDPKAGSQYFMKTLSLSLILSVADVGQAVLVAFTAL